MAVNLKSMLMRARLKLKDIAIRKFSEPDLIAAANEGKNELVKIIRQAREDFFLSSTTSTITVATPPNPSEITLPDDFMELKEIMVTSSGFEDLAFVYKDFADPEFRQALIDGGSFSSGQGSFYYDIVAEKTLRMAPGTDLALSVKIQYIPAIADMELPTDYPAGLPTEHSDFIVTWMICEGMRSVQDDRLGSYEAKLGYQRDSVIASVNQRQVREPQFVKGFMQEEQW
jgi:hypothetical protein